MPLAARHPVAEEQLPETRPSGAILGWQIALVGLGAGLRLWQYAANTALWLNEVPLARNILDRSLWRLLSLPLDNNEVAPKGFLLAEKVAVSVFGSSGYALRLFPLLSSLIALVVFWRIVARWLDGLTSLVALALFATAVPLVVFASQVKQYSSDVAVAMLLLWLALHLGVGTSSLWRGLGAGMAGAVLVWFSQPSVLVVCGLSVSLILFAWVPRHGAPQRRWFLVLPLGLWVVSALVSTLVALAGLTDATQAYMHRFWAAGFAPLSLSEALKTLWPRHQLGWLLGSGAEASLGYPFPALFLGLIVLGFWILWRRDRSLATLLLAPIGFTLAAAFARRYPFSDRLILFLVPSFFVAIGASVAQIHLWLNRWSKPIAVLLPILIAAAAVSPVVKTPPVYRFEDMKPVLAYLRQERVAGDAVYVYYGAAPEVTFYAGAFGLRQDAYAIGRCHRGDTRRYFQELDAFRGRPRLWVLITHARPYGEGDDILRYLDSIGRRREGLVVESRPANNVTSAAEVFLYDLSDPSRLSRATSASSPVTWPFSTNVPYGCEEGPTAMPASGRATQAE